MSAMPDPSATDLSAADPHARLRVAIYGADGKLRALMAGTLKTITANTPPGGRWQAVPSHVRKLADVRR